MVRDSNDGHPPAMSWRLARVKDRPAGQPSGVSHVRLNRDPVAWPPSGGLRPAGAYRTYSRAVGMVAQPRHLKVSGDRRDGAVRAVFQRTDARVVRLFCMHTTSPTRWHRRSWTFAGRWHVVVTVRGAAATKARAAAEEGPHVQCLNLERKHNGGSATGSSQVPCPGLNVDVSRSVLAEIQRNNRMRPSAAMPQSRLPQPSMGEEEERCGWLLTAARRLSRLGPSTHPTRSPPIQPMRTSSSWLTLRLGSV